MQQPEVWPLWNEPLNEGTGLRWPRLCGASLAWASLSPSMASHIRGRTWQWAASAGHNSDRAARTESRTLHRTSLPQDSPCHSSHSAWCLFTPSASSGQGRRVRRRQQGGHLLDLGDAQLPLLYVIEDLWRVLLNFLGVLHIARTHPDHLCRFIAGAALLKVRQSCLIFLFSTQYHSFLRLGSELLLYL
jgi:hypothetical protein